MNMQWMLLRNLKYHFNIWTFNINRQKYIILFIIIILVIKLRTFYIFKINDNKAKVYHKNTKLLYQILESINNIDSNDISFAFNLFKEIVSPYNKNNINEYIYNNYKKDISYVINKNTYIIDNNEFTKIIVNKSNIKVITNKNNPIIFKYFKNYINNLFVCDFKNKDYFWLELLN